MIEANPAAGFPLGMPFNWILALVIVAELLALGAVGYLVLSLE